VAPVPDDGVEVSRMVLAHLAKHDFPTRSPLYAAIARDLLNDDEVLALSTGVAWHELPPMLLLAAVRHLLIADPGEPLAAFHADLTDTPRPPEEAYPLFREFALRHREEITALVRSRAIQTNEVLRCACYMPAVALVPAALGTAEIGLVDVGSSAGLGMLLDRYAYDYGDAGNAGPAEAAVQLRCEVRGDRPPPLAGAPPRIAHRVGLDRAPVDVRDPDATRWLRASVWPGQGSRVELLLGAVEAARADPPRIVAGDAVRDLPGLLDAVPPGLGICVTTSVVLTYLGGERAAFAAALEEAGRRRPLAWVAYDTTHGIDRIEDAPPWVRELMDSGKVDCALVRLSLLTAAGREDRWLARSGYHGEWLEWMGAPD
jgi:hypothetical protein